MTKHEAIDLAAEFIRRHKLPAGAFLAARLMQAERFNRLLECERYADDFWVVDFERILPHDVVAMSPKDVSIVVETSDKVYPSMPGVDG